MHSTRSSKADSNPRINPFYADEAVLQAIRAAWKANGSVALGNILTATPTFTNWRRIIVPNRFSFEGHPRIPEQKILSDFVATITGKRPLRDCSKRFSHRDFTILHDKEQQKPGVVALLFLEDWNAEWGGKIVFMRGGKTLEKFVPRKNTLLIVERKKGTRYFVKYINNKAGKKKLTILSA